MSTKSPTPELILDQHEDARDQVLDDALHAERDGDRDHRGAGHDRGDVEAQLGQDHQRGDTEMITRDRAAGQRAEGGDPLLPPLGRQRGRVDQRLSGPELQPRLVADGPAVRLG